MATVQLPAPHVVEVITAALAKLDEAEKRERDNAMAFILAQPVRCGFLWRKFRTRTKEEAEKYFVSGHSGDWVYSEDFRIGLRFGAKRKGMSAVLVAAQRASSDGDGLITLTDREVGTLIYAEGLRAAQEPSE